MSRGALAQQGCDAPEEGSDGRTEKQADQDVQSGLTERDIRNASSPAADRARETTSHGSSPLATAAILRSTPDHAIADDRHQDGRKNKWHLRYPRHAWREAEDGRHNDPGADCYTAPNAFD